MSKLNQNPSHFLIYCSIDFFIDFGGNSGNCLASCVGYLLMCFAMTLKFEKVARREGESTKIKGRESQKP